ncbi:HAD family hydrolase [Nereida sp. MMG025]|uniref:sulfotransferase-like domain-containing protein n=1 Tax=Nereida sp. MMG025 TaxID=2909981 RepID=UPI001F1E6A27|nr:HAD family hydrolase [Nereida sp. MMG025]MCF6444609.1 HAD family hydrolase [Nereida sp. MMG025]
MTKRIAMWSGPRNLSTTMMYSFASRDDCVVVDEPLYAAYLNITGKSHPKQKAILAAQPTDVETVISACLEPKEAPIFYQKHMSHHMLEGFPKGWIEDLTNVFLLRHPARVIASYSAKRERPLFEDLGFAQQLDLFQRFGGIVIDSLDIRAAPEAMLRQLCVSIGIPFDRKMLKWAKGPKPYDGVWASHWYGAVHDSTGFAGPEGPLPKVDMENAPLLERALPIYEKLRKHRLIAQE